MLISDDIDIVLEAYNNTQLKILFEDKNSDALDLGRKISQYVFKTDLARENEFGDRARELGFRSAKDLQKQYELYQRIHVNNQPYEGKPKSEEEIKKEKEQAELEKLKRQIEYTEYPHSRWDIDHGYYVVRNLYHIKTILELILQYKFKFELKEPFGDDIITIGEKCRLLKPHSINNRGEYRVVQMKLASYNDEQIDGTTKRQGAKLIDKSKPDFDININEVSRIFIDHGYIEIILKYPLSTVPDEIEPEEKIEYSSDILKQFAPSPEELKNDSDWEDDNDNNDFKLNSNNTTKIDDDDPDWEKKVTDAYVKANPY